MSETVTQYLARIGKKGGQASRGTAKARQRAKHAAKIRWSKVRHSNPNSSL